MLIRPAMYRRKPEFAAGGAVAALAISVKRAIWFSSALSLNTNGVAAEQGASACAPAPAAPVSHGSVQAKSAIVTTVGRPSVDPAWLLPETLSTPNPPPMLSAMNGTGTLWVTSMTESILPGLPQ